jgi:hypothetical protein
MKNFILINPFIEILKKYVKEFYDFEDDLTNLHNLLTTDKLTIEDKNYHSKIQKIGINDRNSLFIKNYHTFIDENRLFMDTYHEFIKKHIKKLFPEEEKIVFQKTPNIRISFPNLTAIGKNDNDPEENVIGLHCDADFGHHCEEINFIIPITQMYDTNSIYYEPTVHSSTDYKDYHNLVLEENEFCMIQFNKLKHYNRINTTHKTRISLDIRVIPYSKYLENEDFFKNTKFDIKNKNYFSLL